MSRRAWLSTATGAAVAAGLVKTQFDAVDLSAQQVAAADPTKVMGRFVSAVGTRAKYEDPKRFLRPTDNKPSASSRSPIAYFEGIITPSDLHFERHHGGVPTIAKDQHELLVHGMVERPMVFRMADLERYPQVSRIHFIECSGNGRAAYTRDAMRPELTVQVIDGLLSTSEWIGVPLSTVLREVGVRRGASWILAEGSDSAVMSRSVPLDKATDDALLAYGQNGEAIRPEQGYPLRLMLPGWEGNAQVKWLRRIEVTDRPTMTRDETSKYTDPLGDGTARQFSFVMDAKSVITFPSYGYALPDRGWWEIQGLAWSGRGRITRVEVSTDGGRTWAEAALQGPVLPKCTVRFRHLWEWNGREAHVLSPPRTRLATRSPRSSSCGRRAASARRTTSTTSGRGRSRATGPSRSAWGSSYEGGLVGCLDARIRRGAGPRRV
jgi:sulfane dehydrogenase subunit SoxC